MTVKAEGYAEKTKMVHVQAGVSSEEKFQLKYDKKIMGLPPMVFVTVTGEFMHICTTIHSPILGTFTLRD